MTWWPFSKPKPDPQDFVKKYLERNKAQIPGIRTLDQLSFIVLDTETTGLDTKKDSVLSFGAVKIAQKRILINSAVEWYPEMFQALNQSPLIHGMVERSNQISTSTFVKRLLEYFSGDILVGHHLGFDLAMLQKLSAPFGLDQFKNPTLDTMSLAVRLDHGPTVNLNHVQVKNYSLDALCERHQIPLDDRHTAAGDAHLTALLLLKLLKIAAAKGIVSYAQLLR
ncbi:3'-5' exonuclease [Algoriphagus halophytocola]|uniref:3'-5' exonuclease n=1 Tax=Algoriphagus halophytocola TaxID=2991499 RepID=UPI0022DCF608|nr:3'-5' exonuclease [Algoriphagus sp. TR-M9]WBL42485.1 3'-5' exonuclease [Algoriphagus sp. TR-M9]